LAKRDVLEIDGHQLQLSNLDKVLYPDNTFTKAQVIDYYIRVSQHLLPHFRDRPVTLKRFPDGVRGEFFYEKDVPRFAPKWINTFPVPRRAGGPDIRYILINDLATLVWCANVASLELHPFLHCAPHIDRPTSVVFDLDPGEGADLLSCIEVAFLLKQVLEEFNLRCWPKVSGSKGIQIYVPLNTPTSYEITQPFARSIADLMAKQHPKLVVAEMAKIERRGKVFIDWSQNSDFKTTIGVYSLRAKLGRPVVSLPVTWDELQNSRRSGGKDKLYWQPDTALDRLHEAGDLFAPVLAVQQQLPPVAQQASTPKKLRSKPRQTGAATSTAAPRASAQGSRKRFVVQKHAASHLHYDFRLEMHGVLKSWAVPKGAPYALQEKRLAMATEDHPLAYLEFEGTIPEGQYGGGTVMVWDIGTYELIEGNYYKGDLRFFLQGKKLKGEWRLAKNRSAQNRNWLLLKSGSAMKPPGKKKENASALTGRTLDQIAAENTAQWHSNRTAVVGLDLDTLPQSPMKFIEPMQCQLVAALPEGAEWQYELKLDGYRTLAIKDAGSVKLLSRRNHALNDRFAAVAQGIKGIEDGVILDGEVVALDAQGRPSFNLLQNYKTKATPLIYYVFDLLAYRKRNLTGLPLRQRRELLNELLAAAGDPMRISAALNAPAADVIAAVKEQGLEGLVGKRLDSRYEPGDRRGAWVKYKVNQGQELVIGGYKPGGKDHFENLAVGYYEGDRLLFIAKIKNGFAPGMKEKIFKRFEGLGTKTCPFANLPEPKNARRGEALTAETMKKYCWLKPKLVAHIEFTDWTAANHLRHSKFVALRDDKNPREVFHEKPASA
jgi:bifunctional non-homologous end joining protein LigD